ncbi:MAG: bifunctional folylpolyglutamate synthase/dihydrofolate synthase [Deltaproteobacteria bacterium]|nr:bifunctional folylpolyglutamate synthase/dihydrofolate synthase [Deltaproteobacteria bacterium]
MTPATMKDYPNIIDRLFELQKFGMKFGLDSMRRILDALGRPERDLKLVHVAGTNGKGSVAAMLREILVGAGYRTGLYTSPHLVTFRERIQIDNVFVGEEQVADLAERVWPATDPASPPTFFEFVTAMALLHFRDEKVDLAVVETGLGGRLDSTNVVAPLVSAVTNVSLEHTEHLGTTIEAIASEKAGIIKEGVPLVAGRISGAALEVMEKQAAKMRVPSFMLLGRDYRADILSTDRRGRPTIAYQGPGWSVKSQPLALAGPHQADNAAMALALAETLAGLGYKLSPEKAGPALAKVGWPGRAETFEPGAWPPDHSGLAPLILDGAHNPAGAEALSRLLAAAPRKKLHLVAGVMADKDIGGVLGPVAALADQLYLTRPRYRRAADPGVLLERLTLALGPPKCPAGLYPSIPEALRAAALNAGPEDLVVVSGSLFTAGETRAYLTGAPAVESN